MNPNPLSRRKFLSLAATAVPAALGAQAVAPGGGSGPISANPAAAPAAAAPAAKTPPIGLEMYSVRNTLKNGNDFAAIRPTLEAISKMGYSITEFWAPYNNWSYPQAKEVRMMLDDLGLKSHSTHNHVNWLNTPEGMAKVIELNQILGNKYVVMATAQPDGGREPQGAEAWKVFAGNMTAASDILRPHGLFVGFHNHQTEWYPFADGDPLRPMDVLAKNTPQDFLLQLDVGTCVWGGSDPAKWINDNPGRIHVLHLKDWRPGNGTEDATRCLFGDGVTKWKDVVLAAEDKGVVEYYLMEQEGDPKYSEMETVQKCIDNWNKLRTDMAAGGGAKTA